MKLVPRILTLCFFGLLSLPVFAQTFGEITGRITDSSGAAAPEAAVTATNINTNATRATVTTQSGDYALPSLPPGTYNVKVEKAGFKSGEAKAVNLSVQQTVRLDFALTVGQISESVTIEANAIQLQAENATVGTVVENKRIVELPLNGRNYLQLVALRPTRPRLRRRRPGQLAPGRIPRGSTSISVAGQRSSFNHYSLDGVKNTDPNFNTLRDPAVHRRTAGIQSPDRHLSGGIRPQHDADQRVHQIRW